MDCSIPGLPIHHQLLEFTQTHVHCISDAIQLSHPPSSPSPPAFNLSKSGSFQMSQLFSSGGQSIGVSASTSVLPMNIQDWFPLGWTGWISLQSKGLSRVFSSTTVQKHQTGDWFDSWIGKICWRRDRLPTPVFLGFLCGSAGKESACNAGDMGLIPRSGRSPGEWKGHPPQHSGLENSMDCIVHGVAAYSKCSVFLFFFSFISFSDVTPSFSVPLKPQIH